MTGGEVLAVAGFIVALIGALGTIWWRLYNMIDGARKDAALKSEAAGALANTASARVDALRIHVAERYVSKEGHRESTEQIMGAIGDMRGDLGAIRDRLDRAFDSGPRSTTRRT